MDDVKSTHKVYENRFRVQYGLLLHSAPCAWQLWGKPDPSTVTVMSLLCPLHVGLITRGG